jgi:energy-coupling factor transporter ATP-binding protein EcfA2
MNDALVLRDLRYRYPDGSEALRGIDLTVPEGQCLGLIGPNGAGKSTLLLHLNGILPAALPTTPAVFVHGRPLDRANLPAIRRDVGLLFQDPDDQLFCPTIAEDVGFGPQQFGQCGGELARTVGAALAQVGLDGFQNRSPHHLSRGEKSRVCLAGVLACAPRVLVLDEPTSNLDPRGRREFKALLARIPGTKLIATHDLEMVAELCSRAVVLDGGRIVADGAARQILADEALMLAHGLECPHVLRHLHPH